MPRFSLCTVLLTAVVFAAASYRVSHAVAADVRGDDEIVLDVHFTHGSMGGRRPAKFIAGEKIHATFRVRNIALNAEDKLDMSVGFEMRDKEDYVIYKFDPKRSSYKLPLGNNEMTQSFDINMPRDFQPGEYLIRLIIEDHVRNQTTTRDIPFELLPSGTFGMINLRMAHDRQGNVPATNGFGVGAVVHLLGSVTGHELKDQKTDVAVRLVFHDEHGNEVGEPFALTMTKEVPKYAPHANIDLHLKYQLHTPGRYIMRVYAEDLVSGYEAAYEMPILITDSFAFDDERTAKATKASGE